MQTFEFLRLNLSLPILLLIHASPLGAIKIMLFLQNWIKVFLESHSNFNYDLVLDKLVHQLKL